MTKRLYFDNAYLTRFRARIIELVPFGDRFAVVLDQTAFYPTSGGQPFDQGFLGGTKVVDVVVDEDHDRVLHVVQKPLIDHPVEIEGEIDWDRRFDHMQQHTAQHILSQAFLQVARAETVSFHLGATSATIDLIGPRQIASTDMERAELLANQVIWDDRPVTTRIVGRDELGKLPLRKPPLVTDDVRLVQVLDFDWSACGGTHVARTGEIGQIKVIKWERRGKEIRIEFRSGRRALTDYAQKNDTVLRLAAEFNVGHWELDQAVDRLRAEAKDLRARLRQASRMLAANEADRLRGAAPSVAGVRLIVHNLTGSITAEMSMSELARQLIAEPSVVALLGVGEQKAQLCFARSSNLDLNMVNLVRAAAETLGSRGGGGRADFAQGGGTVANLEQLDTVLEWAAHKLRAQLERAN